MKNDINEYRNRFFNLLESKIGEVKPLLSEEKTKLTGLNKLTNFVAKIKTAPQNIKDWVKKTFGKDNPSEIEISSKLKETQPEIQTPLTPTSEPQPVELPASPDLTIVSKITTEVHYIDDSKLLKESSTNYYSIWNKYQNYLWTQLNTGIKTYVLPYVNDYIATNVIPTIDTCVDLYISEACFDLQIKITDFKINGLYIWDGADYDYPDYTLLGLSVTCAVYIKVENLELYVYPSATASGVIYKNQIIKVSSPKIKITTSSFDTPLAYIWLENNMLKVSNSILGTYTIDLGLDEEFESAFDAQTLDLKSKLPGLYNLTT